VLEFPFLIGRIRTVIHLFFFYKLLTMFPFLIGRIRTNEPWHGRFFIVVFPFLIGRIRT